MKNNLVYKSNELIETSYALTLNEQRLLLACISQVKSDELVTAETAYVITVEEARDLFYNKAEHDQAYRDLKMAAERLFRREIRLFSEDASKELLTRFVSTIEFDHTKQEVQLFFSTGIIPYISNLKTNFTKYRLSYISQFTSVYAVRIYELIVSWYGQNQTYKEMPIDDLKLTLQISDKYRLFGDFKVKVIDPAISQINEFSDYNLDIAYKKRGRSFYALQMSFSRKAEHKLLDENLSKRKQHNLTTASKKENNQKEATKKAEFLTFSEKTIITSKLKFKGTESGNIYACDDFGNITGIGKDGLHHRVNTKQDLLIALFEKRLTIIEE